LVRLFQKVFSSRIYFLKRVWKTGTCVKWPVHLVREYGETTISIVIFWDYKITNESIHFLMLKYGFTPLRNFLVGHWPHFSPRLITLGSLLTLVLLTVSLDTTQHSECLFCCVSGVCAEARKTRQSLRGICIHFHNYRNKIFNLLVLIQGNIRIIKVYIHTFNFFLWLWFFQTRTRHDHFTR
jgi:hypothetical protein